MPLRPPQGRSHRGAERHERQDLRLPGQTRTAALSLKLASREIFYQETGEWPVLLLDDVLSELDARRQEFVLRRINGGQVFITGCQPPEAGTFQETACTLSRVPGRFCWSGRRFGLSPRNTLHSREDS